MICQGSCEVIVSTGDVGRRFEMVVADEVVNSLLPLSEEVMVVVELVARETLMPPGVVALEDGEREARHAAQVDSRSGEAGGRLDGVDLSGLDVRQVEVPVILALVHTHGEHSGEGVVEGFYTASSLGVVGAGGKFMGAQKLVDSA